MSNNITKEQLALYYSSYCPYCHRVLDAMVALQLNPDLEAGTASGIALKNTFSDKSAAQELVKGGGKKTVPCLRIEQDGKIKWMYESADIVVFLKKIVAK